MIKENIIKDDSDKLFFYSHYSTKNPKFVDFNLHTHEDYEIYIFLNGDVRYVVEGINYNNISPYDILLIRGHELHQLFPNPDVNYERIVINISDRFFEEWKCEELRKIFKKPLADRYLSGKSIISAGIDEILERIEKYIHATTGQNDTIVKCALIDFLYNISTLTPPSANPQKNNIVSDIITYINENISSPITLDELTEKFFLSKYYMCRSFKNQTGFTINQYIITKRMILVKELYKKGMNLSNASVEAGFSGYTAFYKAYTKEFGISPKKGLER